MIEDKVFRFIRREDLAEWEAKGWQARSHYAIRSDDIESILIEKVYDDFEYDRVAGIALRASVVSVKVR